ncbi:MAG TPA: TetR/AcrR family transcriptional regulator [Nocardioides sp.]|jgi:AcrR family transcriptional regulator
MRSPPRRTQADRRAATIDALIEATIESLATVGFGATTTRRVAERAGVSQGAQQHYFPSKALLVDAAVNRIVDQALVEATRVSVSGTDDEERAGELLDRVWEAFQQPVFGVVFELLNLARTHPETARLTAATLGSITDGLVAAAAEALPSYAASPGFRDRFLVAVAAIRDTALLARIPGTEPATPSWPVVRAAALRVLSSPS